MKEDQKEINENIMYGILKNNLKVISINKLPFIIGRKEKCDLIINNPSISKKHALIQFDEDVEDSIVNINKSKEIILIDNSLNGIYVNGTKITNGKKILLETGDKISFGNDKNIYIFELMNYDHEKTIIYPNMLSIDKIETNPISLVNEEYYQKSEINHFNTIKTKNSENINISNENINNNKENEIKINPNENKELNNRNNIKNEEKEEKKEDDNKITDNNKSNNYNLNNNYYNIEQIFSLKQEIFELKKENDNLKGEINNLKESIEKSNRNLDNINNIKFNNNNFKNNNYNNYNYKIIETETNNSPNNSNIDLLAEDLRELGLFRRVKEALVPNYSELSFEDLSLKFDNIIIEYKNKYNIAEILLNMENEFNNEIIKFNNIISLQQEQKRDTLNKINYLFNKENYLEENNSQSKVNKYLMEQLNDLLSEKEINIKLINQLKGDIIKLKTEINLYKTINNKNEEIKKNIKNLKLNKNINKNSNNNIISQDYQMKNFIDYNIDKYSIGYDKHNFINNNDENDIKSNNDSYKELSNNYNNINYFFKNDKNETNNNGQKYENILNTKISDDYQRLNILVQNSQDNLKYQEIIKQKELIVNGMK